MLRLLVVCSKNAERSAVRGRVTQPENGPQKDHFQPSLQFSIAEEKRMHSHFWKSWSQVVALAALAAVPVVLAAQDAPKPAPKASQSDSPSRWDIFAGYSYLAPKGTVDVLQLVRQQRAAPAQREHVDHRGHARPDFPGHPVGTGGVGVPDAVRGLRGRRGT